MTVLSTVGAYFASQPAFATPPPLASPGSVFVGVRQGSTPAPVRVDVRMVLQPSPSRTTFNITLLGDPSSSVPLEESGELLLGFCGAMKDTRLQTSVDADNLPLIPLIPPSDLDVTTNAFGAEFSLRDDCRMAVINKRELTDTSIGEGGISWALFIEGETTAATEASAGALHRYVLPRVATAKIPMENLNMDAVAVESVVSIEPDDLPPEYVPTVASPQVDDIGDPEWEFPIRSAGRLEEFRLTGTDQREQAEIQRGLFLGSGLAGVAGGGLIWLFGSLGASPQKSRTQALSPAREPDAFTLNLAEEVDHPHPRTYKRLVAASVLSATAASTLTWFLSRRRP
ncbi:Uncharacterised protein [Kocuria rosea]|nr:Uncharacterised protein [Kocuria rosea]